MEKRKVIIAALCGGCVLLCGFFALLAVSHHDIRKPHKGLKVKSRAALEKVLEINELQSLEYIYNSYVIAYEDDVKEVFTLVDAFFAAELVSEANYGTFKEEFSSLRPVLVAEDSEFDKHVMQKTKEFAKTYYGLDVSNDKLFRFVLTYYFPAMVPETFAEYTEEIKNAKNEWREERKESYKYAVAYRGTVRAGINEPVTFSVDDRASVVRVTIPAVKVLDVNIEPNEETMRFLYKKSKFDKGNIKKILKLCEDDLRSKVSGNPAFLELAEQNVIETIKILCAPFEKSTAYTFIVEGE